MRVLTPFEFVELYPEGRRMVLVGNAPSLRGQKLGDWIDSHDIVVRFNACPVKGYQDDVGSRTSILVTNPYPEGREKPAGLSVEPQTLLVITPQTRRGSRAEFENWAGDVNVLFTYTPDLVGVENADHKAGLTTGTYALQLLPRICKPAHVSVTGFTMFLGNSSYHYWSPLSPQGLRAHDLEWEAKIFIHLCNRVHCPLEITEDIAWMAQKTETVLRKKEISIRPLSKGDWSR